MKPPTPKLSKKEQQILLDTVTSLTSCNLDPNSHTLVYNAVKNVKALSKLAVPKEGRNRMTASLIKEARECCERNTASSQSPYHSTLSREPATMIRKSHIRFSPSLKMQKLGKNRL